MKTEIEELNTLIEQAVKEWSGVPKNHWFDKPNPAKWSNAEVVGHLIDSAQNNIQRFIRSQYEDAPKVFYSQDDWVRLQHYNTVEKEELIQLWASLNRQIVRIIKGFSKENLEKPCYFKVEGVVQIVPISFVFEDYLAHLKHHKEQI
jgi:coenzyme F420-reducing hydrogenase alpha subunit